jgi:glycine betaine transporter
MTFKTILHPTDFSEHSRSALQLAAALAQSHGARVVVVHVQFPTSEEMAADFKLRKPDFPEEVEQRFREYLAQEPNLKVERLVRDGKPAVEILKLAESLPCDLIVMGTRGRTGIAHALLGSVAEEVIRNARCPVVSVRAPSGK